MGAFSFANTSVTIKAGQAVNFNDPSDTGGSHVLVTGTNGQFAAASGAPSQFASSDGINFAPGDSMTIKFPTAGTFSITCKIHPSMHATVTVKP
jgi:plastocyanin